MSEISRFSLCCGACNQPLELFEAPDRLWGLACPEMLSPFLCRRLDHSLYATFIPTWFRQPGSNILMGKRGGLLASRRQGKPMKVFERVFYEASARHKYKKKGLVRDLTVIYELDYQFSVQNVRQAELERMGLDFFSPAADKRPEKPQRPGPELITHECDTSEDTLRLIREYNGRLLVGKARA